MQDELTSRAFRNLKAFLSTKAQTNPTERQLHALHALMDNMSRLVFHKATGRYAWPLPVGCGKTTSACHFVAQVVKDRVPVSVAIACSQVSALNEINKFLVEQLHVSQKTIGTLVSYDKATDVRGRYVRDGTASQILLMTHARIHMGEKALSRYWTYQGRERDLLIYDESLISSKSVIVDAKEVLDSFSILKGRIQRGELELSRQFYSHLDMLIGEFHSVRNRVEEQIQTFVRDKPGSQISSELRYQNFFLRPLDPEGQYAADIDTIQAETKWSQPLQAFFDLCGTTVRLVCDNLGTAVLSFNITVPEHITNMVILDASSPIRLLGKLDKVKITQAEDLPLIKASGITNLANLFDYSNVSLHVCKAGAGYSTLLADTKNLRIKDAVDLLSAERGMIDPQDSVLFYVFKRRTGTDHPAHRPKRRIGQRGPLFEKDIKLELETELKRNGYDLTTGLVCIETFGKETSSNNYAHCSHVIFVGTPWQNPNDLVAMALGQERDINRHLEDELLKDLNLTEVAYRYHQGAGRGSMRRNGPDGKPQKMSIYCFLTDKQKEEIVPHLLQVLPGMQVAKARVAKRHQKTSQNDWVKEAIREALKGLVNQAPVYNGDQSTKWESVRSFKVRVLQEKTLQSAIFSRLLSEVLPEFPQVSKQGRSLVYEPGCSQAA